MSAKRENVPVPRQTRSRRKAAGVDESPCSLIDEDVTRSHYPLMNPSTLSLPAQSHKRRPSPFRIGNNRSISPPSIRDVPSLTRSGTAYTLSSTSSSSRSSSLAPSLSSRSSSVGPNNRESSTPASLSSAIDDSVVVVDPWYSPSLLESTAYGKAIAAVRPSMKGHQNSFQGESQQPTKKVKTSGSSSGGMGSVMARFFNSATSGYGRANRSAVSLPQAA